MTVAVIVPWRPDSAERDRNWSWLKQQWRRTGWDIIEGRCPEGPWVKGAAVADALSKTTAQTLVITDADVWCTATPYAVRAVEAGAPWVVPHQNVHRLTEETTRALVANDPSWDELEHAPTAQRPYPGVPAGGLTVITRDLYEQAPLDPRFEGWGQEDEAAGHAWTILAGPPRRGTAPLFHLWHQPQERIGRVIGSPESKALRDRYRTATTPMGVLAIAAEHT